MRKALVALLSLLMILIALRFGWPAIIFGVFVYFVVVAFVLPSARKQAKTNRFPLSRLFFLLLAFFLGLSFFVSWRAGEWLLQLPAGDHCISSACWFYDSLLLRVFYAAMIGVLTIGVPLAIGLLVMGYLSAQTWYSMHEQYKDHKWQATLSAIGVMLGMSNGTCVIRSGEAEFTNSRIGSLERFGGPGTLVVQEGHAVVLERNGAISRVVGRGVHWLDRLEQISLLIPLKLRSEHVIVKDVATKDKILLKEFEFWAYHKADPGPDGDPNRIVDGLYEYNEEIILTKMWTPTGGDWRSTVLALGETAARDVVGRYTLEEIVPIADAFRTRFKAELAKAMNVVAQEKMGIKVVTVDIGRVAVPEEAEKRLLAKWLADWNIQVAASERDAMIRKGEGEAAILKLKEVAWAQAQKQLIEQITSALKLNDPGNREAASYVIALRSLETLEKMAGDPATKILLPNDVVTQLRDLKALLGTQVGQFAAVP